MQRLDESDDSILPSWASEAAGAVADVGAQALETATELPGRAAEFTLESIEAVVEALAPGLLRLLRGGAVAQIADLFCAGLDMLVGRWFAALGELDLMSDIESTFRGLTAGLGVLQTSLGAGASAALGTILEPLVAGLEVWGGPLIETLQDTATTVNGLFSGLWEQLAVPALGFLESVGGAVWEGFSRLVTAIWELSAPVREFAQSVWTRLMERFDLAWNSTADVRATLSEKASESWADFLATIEPIRTPLMVAGGILLLLSPLGPIVVLSEVIPPLWEKVTWLWNNWNTEDILVTARTVLTDDVLPGVIGAVGGAASALSGAYAWLAGLVTQLGTAMTDVLGAFGGSRCLTAVTTYLNGVSEQFARLGAWANSGFQGLVPALQAVFGALVAILRPILDFLVRLGMVVLNPSMLPLALTAGVWLLCPDRLKTRVINFVYDLLIAFVDAFPAMLMPLGSLAAIVKAGILGYLRHLRGGEGVTDKTRIDVSNKVAGIAVGGGLDFIAGLAFGLLHGVLDGIIDPFRLIFLLGRVMILGAGVVGRALAPFVRETVPGFAGFIQMARGPPMATGTELPVAGTPTDAQVAAALSPETASELPAAGQEPDVDEAALEQEARAEAESKGATVGGLAELLADAWAWMLAAAEQLGAMIAAALLKFIMQSDFQLGRSLGFVAGFLLLQGLIIYFSAGGYAALKGVEPALRQLLIYLVRFLDLGGEILGVLGRALRPLKAPLLRGLGAIRGFLNRFAFARALVERIERLAARLFRFSDEAAGAGAAGAADAAAGRAAGETAEAAVREPGERAAREALESGERASVEAADELGEGALRAVDEPGVPPLRDDALKAAQLLEAQLAARAIAEAHDAVDAPVPVVLGALALLKRRYRWIDAFYARPRAPGVFRLVFTATPDHVFDESYSPGPPLTVEDLRKLFPGVIINKKRRAALDFMNRLPAADRDFLIQRLRRFGPRRRGATLSEIGDLSGRVHDVDTLAAGLRGRRTGEFLEEGTDLQRHIREVAPESIDEADELAITQTVTWRVHAGQVQTGRAALKRRMTAPTWAGKNSRLWNPHHLIPVEHQGHGVFNVLRETPSGWDHNHVRNGIALPTDPDLAKTVKLPVHQFNRDVLDLHGGDPGALRDLWGHPIWNEYVKGRLDDIYDDYLLHGSTSRLRREVYLLCGDLRETIRKSGWTVLR